MSFDAGKTKRRLNFFRPSFLYRTVLQSIRSQEYDVAVTDMVRSRMIDYACITHTSLMKILNSGPLALADDLGIPMVGFSASAPVGPEFEATGIKST